jgi:hypothetical protein
MTMEMMISPMTKPPFGVLAGWRAGIKPLAASG